jgi:hypothetical protein
MCFALLELLDRFFEISRGTKGTFNKHFIGKFNVKGLLHVQEYSDRSHRIQTELRKLYVVVDGVQLHQAEVPA